MDTPIEKKFHFRKKHIFFSSLICLLIILLIFRYVINTSSSLKVEKERITIAKVIYGDFNDYIRVLGQVVPSQIIYLDAIEGGQVVERLIEEGAQVKKGDVIIRLSNPLLNIGILQSEANLMYQENELRNTRINMEHEHLRLKQERVGLLKDLVRKERQYLQTEHLFQKSLIAKEDYLLSKEDYEMTKELLAVVDKRIEQDNTLRKNQLESLDENILNMKQSLVLVRSRLENLKVKAPINGQLGILDAQIGQSIAQGERIGQIIVKDFKVQAQIDEHYVERVYTGLTANFEREGLSYSLKINKVFPEVRNGQFLTDLVFTTKCPDNIRAGQSYHLNLQLGDKIKTILLPRGSFYQTTGGQYVYVISENGKKAHRRNIKIGRQNPQYFEVLEGVKPGEQVIISDYELFGKNEQLNIK